MGGLLSLEVKVDFRRRFEFFRFEKFPLPSPALTNWKLGKGKFLGIDRNLPF
jgi:hypothetical protein